MSHERSNSEKSTLPKKRFFNEADQPKLSTSSDSGKPALPNTNSTKDTGSLKPEMFPKETDTISTLNKILESIRVGADKTIVDMIKIAVEQPNLDMIPAKELERRLIHMYRKNADDWLMALHQSGGLQTMIIHGREQRKKGKPVDFD